MPVQVSVLMPAGLYIMAGMLCYSLFGGLLHAVFFGVSITGVGGEGTSIAGLLFFPEETPLCS